MGLDPHHRRAVRAEAERFLGFDLGITEFGGLHIEPEELSELIVDHGIGAELRRAQACPCTRAETGGPRGSCSTCRGLRWIHPEERREAVVVTMTSQSLQRAALAGGKLLTGTVQLLFPTGIVPGEGDLVLPDGEVHVVHETLWRADQPVRPSRVRAAVQATDEVPRKVGPRRERLLYPEVEAVESVWYWDATASLAVRAAEGHDYRMTPGRVEWFEGMGPAVGEAYTVRYTAPAAYMLFPGEPVFRPEAGRAYPYRALGQRLDRWGSPDYRDAPAPGTP